MKHKIAAIGAIAVAAGAMTALSACHSESSTATGMAQPQMLDTAQVLAQAKQTSEVDSPYQVDDGALTLTDTSDTSVPIVINGM
jgi:hypothetical protein